MRIRPTFSKQQYDRIAGLLGACDAPPKVVNVFLVFCAYDNSSFNGKKFQQMVTDNRPKTSAWKWQRTHYKEATAEGRGDDRLAGRQLVHAMQQKKGHVK